MRTKFERLSLAGLCSWFGITRQAFYQYKKRSIREAIKQEVVLEMVDKIRSSHPRIGGKKLYAMLKKAFKEQGIKMGRDRFFDILRTNDLLIKRRKCYHITTNSKHWMKKYPNLIQDIEPVGSNHILVSDITYWKVKDRHYYISFVTDAFSRKIKGYHVAETMEAVESVAALKMALKGINRKATGIIHHSDRGAQYCSAAYVKVLKKRGIRISMTEKGDPLENAIAERINGIIKGEYLYQYNIDSLQKAGKVLKAVVKLYNEERPHLSLNNMTPTAVENGDIDCEIRRLWKNYYKTKQKCNTAV